jgi:hypothetical protein
VEDLGLPTRIEARLPDGTTGVRIELESVQEEPYQARDFERPADYRHPAGDRRPLQKPRRNGDGLPTPDIVRRALDEDDAAPARAGERLFALMPDEDVKVLFSDTLITRAIDAVNNVSSYLGEFAGQRFIFETHRWPHQVEANAPRPQNAPNRSVLPSTLIRIGLVLLAVELGQLNLGMFSGDFTQAVNALTDAAQKFKWQRFLARVDQRLLRPALQDYAARDIANCGRNATSDAQLILELLSCADPLLQDYTPQPGEAASELGQLKELGRIWLGNLFPQIDVSPNLPNVRTRQGAQVFYSDALRTIRVDSLEDWVNVEIGEWTHQLDFGRQPLLAPFRFVDNGGASILQPLFPDFSEWDQVRVGLFTGLRLQRLEIDCGVDIEPTFSAKTFFLGLFCPPCLFALFHSGSASVEATEIELPVFLYAHQDEAVSSTPELRLLVGEPSFGNIAVSLSLFDDWFAAILSLGLSYLLDIVGALLAAIIGDDILEGVLKALAGKLSEPIDAALRQIPLLNPGEIVKIDSVTYRERFPEQKAVPEVRKIAYRGRMTPDGSFHLETDASLSSTAHNFGPMVFPPEGEALDSDLAVVMSNAYVAATLWDLRRRSSAGPLMTRKPDGTISEVDWWVESPDLTGMPPRPAISQQGPPPGLILQPGVQASYWGYSCLIQVGSMNIRLRDLNASPPGEPVADLELRVSIETGVSRFVTVTYDVCEDVTRFAAKLLDPRDPFGPRREPRPGPSPDPRFGGTLIEGRFQRRSDGPANDMDGVPVRGRLEDMRFGYLFSPPDRTPLPDDPGPEPVPGTILCKTVTSWDVAERQTWLTCETRFTVPVHLGILETLNFRKAFAGGINILPLMDYRINIADIVSDQLPLTIQANGPLATLTLPDNQAWLKEMMLREAVRMVTRYDFTDVAQLRTDYGLESFVTLDPGAFRPSLFVRLDSYTAFQTSTQGRNLAIRISLLENILNRL